VVQRGRHDLGHVIGWDYVRRRLLLPARTCGLRTDPVDRAAVRDGQRPGGGAAPGRVEPRRRAPDLEQHLLGDFLRLGRISQHLPDHPVHRPGQLTVDHFERLVVAARHPG
jgi:hypothetical protein